MVSSMHSIDDIFNTITQDYKKNNKGSSIVLFGEKIINLPFEPRNKAHKRDLLLRARRIAKLTKASNAVLVCESWFATQPEGAKRSDLPENLEDYEEKKEGLIINIETPDKKYTRIYLITRDEKNNISDLELIDGLTELENNLHILPGGKTYDH